MRYSHTVIYLQRPSAFTDERTTRMLEKALRRYEEDGWALVNAAPRSGPLGDVSGVWLFFKRPCEARSAAYDIGTSPSIAERVAA